MITEVNALHAEAFLDEAVDFVHFSECCLGPPFLPDDTFDFLAERLDILRVRCEVKQGVREHLRYGICYVRPRSGPYNDANAHGRTSRPHAEALSIHQTKFTLTRTCIAAKLKTRRPLVKRSMLNFDS